MLENLREVKDKLKKRSWHKGINVAVALAVVAMLAGTIFQPPTPVVYASPEDYDVTYSMNSLADAEAGWDYVGPDLNDVRVRNTDGAWCWTDTASPSGSTGPPDGVACVYTETSTPVEADDVFTMTLTTAVSATTYGLYVTLDRCTQGVTEAHLYFEAWNGTGWDAIDDWAGDSVTTFTSEGPYDFTSYTNSDWKIRFRTVVGGTAYRNDMAVDEVRIYGNFKGPTTEQLHFRWRNDSYGLNTDDGWYAAEDNAYNSLHKETTVRPRVEIANTAGTSADNYQYLLEYSTDTGGPWTAVPVTATTEPFEMVNSGQYTDGDDITSGLLTATGTWANGKGVEDPSNMTASFSLTTTYYTEFEYAIQATTDATAGGTYYFRLTDNGSDLNTYTRYPEVTIYSPPIVDQVHYRWRNDDWSGTPAWGHTDYTHRKKITLTSDTGKIPSTQSNFPLWIDVTDANLRTTGDGGFVQNANGWDVMFTDSDGSTALDREMTEYTSSSGSANYSAWVRVPSLSTSKEIYMYYGKSGVSSDPSTTTTWDSNFKMVHHLQETSGTHQDSTANDNDGTCYGGVTQDATGRINGGDEFDGIDNYINCGSASSLGITGNITLEAWVKKATPVIKNPAEWEPMQGVLIRYDGNIFDITYEVIKEMSEDVQIVTLCSTTTDRNEVISAFSTYGVNCADGNCLYLVDDTESEWTRDYGPWWIWSETDEYRIVDYTYNRDRPLDNDCPSEYAAWAGLSLDLMDLVHSGGNWMSDGTGIAVSTELVWDENTGKSHAEIDQEVANYLGIHTYYHVVPDALGAYIKHIDCFAKFLSPDTVMVLETETDDPQYQNLEDAATYFENANSCYGTPYTVYRLYVPGTDEYTYDEPYVNSLILNTASSKKVFVPILGTSQWDDDAITSYENAMPGYEVIAVDDTGTGGRGWMNTDAMHCRARGIPQTTPWDYDFIVSKGQDAYHLQMNRVGSTLHGYISENETPTTTSTPTDWHHYALTFNGTAQNLFIDGVSANTTAHVGAIGSNSENVTIGGSCAGYDPTSDDFFSGTIDEVRISNTARTADWIKTSYSNQDNPSAFYTLASLESYPEGATWKELEDTAITGQARFEDIRLRFSIKNTGGQASAYNYRLQVSDNETSGYTDVPAAAGCGYAVACMTTSTYFADQATTTNQLSVPDALAWTGGKMVEGDSNQSDAITIDNDEFTEVEFIFQFTSNAPGSTTYYFRVAKGGSSTPLDSYSENATITTESTPTWVSYSDDTHETVCEDFDVYETEHWVYMHGEGFTAEETYKVIYWDPLGTKRAVDSSVEAGPTGNLSSPHEFVFGDEPGDWHCTVYHPDTHDPESYSTTDPYIVADDTSYTSGYAYHMAAAAIPEFPTVISAIAVAGLCFGIYYWMRKRYRRVEVSRY